MEKPGNEALGSRQSATEMGRPDPKGTWKTTGRILQKSTQDLQAYVLLCKPRFSLAAHNV